MLVFLEKLHKNPYKIRPIVSGIEGPTEHLSAFLDTILKPIVSKLPSFVRDSTHIVATLTDLKLPSEVILVTIDVSSLYTSIPHHEGIMACLQCIEQGNTTNTPPKSSLHLI